MVWAGGLSVQGLRVQDVAVLRAHLCAVIAAMPSEEMLAALLLIVQRLCTGERPKRVTDGRTGMPPPREALLTLLEEVDTLPVLEALATCVCRRQDTERPPWPSSLVGLLAVLRGG